MYHFNLLTEQEQKHAKHWIIGKHISNGLILINGTLLIAIIMLLSGIYAFQQIVDSSELTSVDGEVHNMTVEIDIPQTNQRIRGLADIQSEHPNYISLLVQLTDIIPPGLLINNLDISYEERVITLSGTAEDRDALKNLQFTIENDERFVVEQFPFDSFTQASEIPFAITMTFDSEAFTQNEVTEEL